MNRQLVSDPPVLSVVVPTRNSAATLGRCLASVRSQMDVDGRPFPVELIVVDNHSTDRTVDVARTKADVTETWGPERSAQRNRGTALATAPRVLFIDSDMVLSPSVCFEVVRELTTAPTSAVVVPEESFGSGYWAKCRGLEKQIAMGDARTEAARGFRVDTLMKVGAWSESLTAAEDWDLTERVVDSGAKVGRVAALIFHDEGHLTLRQTFTKKRYYGRWVGSYLTSTETATPNGTVRGTRTGTARGGGRFLRRYGHMSPMRILRRPALLVRRPDLAVGLVTLKAVEAAGVLLGIAGARKDAGGTRSPLNAQEAAA